MVLSPHVTHDAETAQSQLVYTMSSYGDSAMTGGCAGCRRGKWMQADADSNMFEVVTAADWCQLLQMHAPHQQDMLRLAAQSCWCLTS